MKFLKIQMFALLTSFFLVSITSMANANDVRGWWYSENAKKDALKVVSFSSDTYKYGKFNAPVYRITNDGNTAKIYTSIQKYNADIVAKFSTMSQEEFEEYTRTITVEFSDNDNAQITFPSKDKYMYKRITQEEADKLLQLKK